MEGFGVAIVVRTHESGNGYVILRVDWEPAALDVVLDPARHADILMAMLEVGRALVVGRTAAGQRGWIVDLDVGGLADATRAALTHPRRVRLALPRR